MGNSAVITTAPYSAGNVGIYVHWNGGRESVEGFAKACKELGYRDPTEDCYGIARLVESIALFFGSDGLSIGVDTCNNLGEDIGDNGVWLIGPGWTVTRKGGVRGPTRKLTPEDERKRDSIAATIVSITKAAEIVRATAAAA